jgi:hypothetical protein
MGMGHWALGIGARKIVLQVKIKRDSSAMQQVCFGGQNPEKHREAQRDHIGSL